MYRKIDNLINNSRKMFAVGNQSNNYQPVLVLWDVLLDDSVPRVIENRSITPYRACHTVRRKTESAAAASLHTGLYAAPGSRQRACESATWNVHKWLIIDWTLLQRTYPFYQMLIDAWSMFWFVLRRWHIQRWDWSVLPLAHHSNFPF
jgi:hypothetical protein